MFLRAMGGNGGAQPYVLTDTTVLTSAATSSKTLYTATANKNAKIEMHVLLGASQNWSNAGFNNCSVTIGSNTYALKDYTKPWTDPTASVDVEINAPVASGESIGFSLVNNSGQYTKTFETTVTIS